MQKLAVFISDHGMDLINQEAVEGVNMSVVVRRALANHFGVPYDWIADDSAAVEGIEQVDAR